MTLYERCQQNGMPVFIHPDTHLGPTTRLEFAQPYLFDEVAREFPGLPLVFAQVGHPWADQTLTLIGKHPRVYADLSDLICRPWQLYNVLLLAYQQNVCDHLLLGSDFPFRTAEQAIITIYSVNSLTHGTNLPTVPREQLRLIVERDALTCLGLKLPPGAVAEPASRRTEAHDEENDETEVEGLATFAAGRTPPGPAGPTPQTPTIAPAPLSKGEPQPQGEPDPPSPQTPDPDIADTPSDPSAPSGPTHRESAAAPPQQTPAKDDDDHDQEREQADEPHTDAADEAAEVEPEASSETESTAKPQGTRTGD